MFRDKVACPSVWTVAHGRSGLRLFEPAHPFKMITEHGLGHWAETRANLAMRDVHVNAVRNVRSLSDWFAWSHTNDSIVLSTVLRYTSVWTSRVTTIMTSLSTRFHVPTPSRNYVSML